jgi:hypothetical protein
VSRQGWSRRILVAVSVLGLTACGSVSEPSPIPTPLDRVVEVDRGKAPEGVITYITERGSPAHGGSVEDAVEIRTRDDLTDLRGAPDDFKAFIVEQLAARGDLAARSLAARGYSIKWCDFRAEIRVWGLAGNVATGRERACELDPNDVIWAKVNGAWRPVARMQGGWDCATLDRYRVPADITAAVCWYDGWKTRAYDGPRS